MDRLLRRSLWVSTGLHAALVVTVIISGRSALPPAPPPATQTIQLLPSPPAPAPAPPAAPVPPAAPAAATTPPPAPGTVTPVQPREFATDTGPLRRGDDGDGRGIATPLPSGRSHGSVRSEHDDGGRPRDPAPERALRLQQEANAFLQGRLRARWRDGWRQRYGHALPRRTFIVILDLDEHGGVLRGRLAPGSSSGDRALDAELQRWFDSDVGGIGLPPLAAGERQLFVTLSFEG